MLSNNDLENLKKALIFVLTPTIEVIATQPIWAIMKQLQGEVKHKPVINLNPAYLYRGFSYNLGGFSATIIMQMYLTDALENKLSDNPTSKQKACAAFVAGVASSLIACPTDALMTWQQNPVSHIKPKLFHCMPATMAQESSCSVFFLVVGPLLKRLIQPYIQDQNVASFAAGTGAGMSAALISQPANTIRSFQQKAKSPQGFFKTAEFIYSRYGLPGLFQGTSARFGMVTASIAIMTFVKDYLEETLEVNDKSSTCQI